MYIHTNDADFYPNLMLCILYFLQMNSLFLDEIDTDLRQSVHIPKSNISLFFKLYGGWI